MRSKLPGAVGTVEPSPPFVESRVSLSCAQVCVFSCVRYDIDNQLMYTDWLWYDKVRHWGDMV